MASVSVLTPTGRGAVATVQINGVAMLDEPPPLFIAGDGRSVSEQPVGRVCFGRWGHESSEEVVLCRVDEDTAEIHCHGGNAAVVRIVAELETRGDGRGELQEQKPTTAVSIEAECRTALTRATTLRTADILWQQCQGRLANAFAEFETLSPENAKRRAAQMFRWVQFGRHLTEPWRVVLCGRPNVGKSSLINVLVGYGRSIVVDQPGTTRDVVTVETALEGWPIELSDTAGLRDDADELETVGIARARMRLKAADLRILLLDTSRPPHDDDRRLLVEWPDALRIAHKSDLPDVWGEALPPGSLAVSSVTGHGIDELLAAIVTRLIPEVPSPLTSVPVSSAQAKLLEQIVAADQPK